MFFFLGIAITMGTYIAVFKDNFDKESLNTALYVIGTVIGLTAVLSVLGSIVA